KKHSEFEQRVVIELKVLRAKDSYETIRKKTIEQTVAYADSCDATAVYILVFDRDERHNWREKIFEETVVEGKYTIQIHGL
ncbi:MAG: hypothetical protein JXR95_00190, partial [Deltaproteobacteria bacterium]|nr:hypothetical protein [Deltaproteobacteria bacterium]